MEIHKDVHGIEEVPDLNQDAIAYFRLAQKFVNLNYKDELDRVSKVDFNEVDQDFFFSEYIWVVHATGFSAKAVGKFIKKLLEAYGSYDSISGEPFETMFARVKKVCNNEQKAFAVYKTAKILKEASKDWKKWKQENASHPDLLKKLPYIGKVTCFHLARNIGLLEFVKPDLHLVRMAKHWGFKDSVSLCEAVRPVGMPLGVVDLILWFSASTFGTISIKKNGER